VISTATLLKGNDHAFLTSQKLTSLLEQRSDFFH
jgi:hypothetical protein